MSTRTANAPVEPRLLIWARETAGLSQENVARALKHKDAERVVAWEAGEQLISVGQLRRLAELYKRPLAAFFLSEPPRDPRRPRDFRSLTGSTPADSPALLLEVRRATARREAAENLFAELEEEPPRFELRASIDDGAEAVGARIRDHLMRFMPEPVAARDQYAVLRAWKRAAEDAGVLVFQTTRIDLAEMRGFSIAENPLPAAVLNSHDSALGRVFTLLHEIAHITLRQGGVCDTSEDAATNDDRRVEVFCNHVAGAVLLAGDVLLGNPAVRRKGRGHWTVAELAGLSRELGASREAILRRLVILGRASEANYQNVRRELLEEYQARQANDSSGFAPMFRKVLGRNGNLFSSVVFEGLRRDVITETEVSRLLDTKLRHIEDIAAELHLARA